MTLLLDLSKLVLPPTEAELLTAAKKAKLTELNTMCDQMAAEVLQRYSSLDVSSWSQQVKEAEAIMEGSAVEPTLLKQLSGQRGINLMDLAEKVLVKAAIYSCVSGLILGKKQKLEDRLDVAATVEEVNSIVWEG